jgi:RND family efflux transporter MFP subunit
LLAEIESPDADQQVAQARADLAQAQANLVQSRAALSKSYSDLNQARANLFLGIKSWERWKYLVKQGAVAQQDADTRYSTYKANLAAVQSAENSVKVAQANVNATQAIVNSNQANLKRYAVLQSFEKVTAPFTGVITARNVNAGVLVTPPSSVTSGSSSLYTIASYDNVYANVYVPQSLAQSLRKGQPAEITVREFPQRIFTGSVYGTTNALDPNTRTLLTQVVVKNSDGALRPGMYASVNFNIARLNPPFIVPDSALVINASGTQVATVTKNNTVHYQKVDLGRDFGNEIEVTSGLRGDELLLTTPTVDQTEGMRIQPVLQKTQQK